MDRREALEALAHRIAQARQAKGWSQGRLARKLGVSNQSVSDWESGVYFPLRKHLVRAGYALGVELEEGT